MQLSRSCQKNRNNDKDHKEFEICCHHCGGNHLSTDYNCAVIKEYRSKVISEIKHHPERLPPNVQLFSPSQYRDPRESSKVIYNNKVTNHQSQIKQQQYNRNDNNVWPNLNFPFQNMSTTTSSIMNVGGVYVSPRTQAPFELFEKCLYNVRVGRSFVD
ncbi:unnamed protein product [Didymodactylos carnosus]|uniref:Uncharacterized protein n=1 Tax=Didymodactylos carnosus TaxID=1234261 RepID=A0A816ADC1_9BILA|nr:unnamed protein product [Didymodactylos carnosus]CAF1595363.1 unnamed protein product [Didymodactylos carnosus]CAF4092418.1 unnamed protein product [Didymodactylos carnosus]CAF4469771.1 unnamed protein product [Didymodactylos carnosus]